MALNFRPINTELRPIPHGYIARIHLGDRWAWRCFDANREPLSRGTAYTAREATEKVAEAYALALVPVLPG